LKFDSLVFCKTSSEINFFSIPSSNMYGCKRAFTEKSRDIRRSYTVFVHGHRIRRSYKNTEWFDGKFLYSVYGAIRLPYTVVYGYNMRHFSDSHWKWVSI
jgi:hypothetical protein